MVDYQMMSRNVRGFMSLFHSDKPVVCKVHGFCVAGGTDMALCSRPARHRGQREDRLSAGARLGRADHRGVDATASASRRRSGCSSPAIASRAPRPSRGGSRPSARRAQQLDERFESLLGRIARDADQPARDEEAARQPDRDGARGSHTTQLLGTVFDGISRHTPEGYAFQKRAAEVGFKQAVRERDEPFGDFGASTYKGST